MVSWSLQSSGVKTGALKDFITSPSFVETKRRGSRSEVKREGRGWGVDKNQIDKPTDTLLDTGEEQHPK